MTAVSPDITEQFEDLEAATREAWAAYRERLRGLTGEAYEQAEPLCWEKLEVALQRIERNRRRLMGATEADE